MGINLNNATSENRNCGNGVLGTLREG